MSSILDRIGNTPLIEIRHLNPNPKVKLLAKLEYFNPGGSVKDRIAKSMIEAAEAAGALTPEKTVLEATSGNTGIGLALVCALKGYRLMLTMSEAVSIERQKILKAFGAELRLTPARLGTDGAIEEAYRLAREHPDTYYLTDQFNNEANWRAHYEGTGREIWEQTRGTITMLVATMGTTGTLMGTSRRLKEFNPDVIVVGVEPYLGHKIQGLKNMKESYTPEIYDKNRLDKKVNVDDDQAYDMARRLARKEGLFVGMSSGAAMAIACEQVKTMDAGVVVVILPDGGERYLSTPLFSPKEETTLHFYNTLTRSKQSLQPLVPPRVSVFTCGPTVDNRVHIGQCRRLILADLLCRYLEYKGFEVTQIVNVTDLDDKTIQASERAGVDIKTFTDSHFQAFLDDMQALGVKPATRYARASDHIDDMVALTSKLLKKGFAYEKLQSVYFDISRFADYGKLSGVDLNKIRLGATVDLDEYEKDNPRDFTLLKRAKLSELKSGIYTKTEWGNVRPSWHIQSVAIAMKYLGCPFDIYTSSKDLLFPHHENEIAISVAATDSALANSWIHTELVLSQGKKAAAGPDVPYVRDLLDKGYSGRAVRYWLLSHNHHKPLHFSYKALDQAAGALKRLDECVRRLADVPQRAPNTADVDQLLYDLKTGFTDALDDDLDIARAMAAIFRQVRKINRLLTDARISKTAAKRITQALRRINDVVNLFSFEQPSLDARIEQLVQQRQQARKNKDWALADKIREELVALGVQVKDTKIGP